MMAITGVCPFDPSAPGEGVGKGEKREEEERVRMGWDREKVFKLEVKDIKTDEEIKLNSGNSHLCRAVLYCTNLQ